MEPSQKKGACVLRAASLGNKNHKISTSTTAAIGGGSSSSAGKTKQRYLCQDCGEDYSQWYGQCPGCKAWDSMKVFREPISNANGGSACASSVAAGVPGGESIAVSTGAASSSGIVRYAKRYAHAYHRAARLACAHLKA